jgi:cytochrome c oxidase assembly protein subunit 11
MDHESNNSASSDPMNKASDKAPDNVAATSHLSQNPPSQEELAAKNKKTARFVGLAVLFMLVLSFASVPLYRIFCSVTGFGGTPMFADKAPDTVLEREMTIRFTTSTASDIPWHFKPEQNRVTVKVGQKTLINFVARNDAPQNIIGTAVYNVTPPKAGKYFQKMECFCFGEQLLVAGQTMNMPVVFFIDPKIADDPNMDDVTNITLSYSFFKSGSERLERALDAFYNQPEYSSGLAGTGQ